jgi:hypothetical protein
MGRPEELVHGVPIAGVVLQGQDVPLQDVQLGIGLREEVLQQLGIVRIEVIAHDLLNTSYPRQEVKEVGPGRPALLYIRRFYGKFSHGGFNGPFTEESPARSALLGAFVLLSAALPPPPPPGFPSRNCPS